VTGTGVEIAERNGRVEVTFQPGAQEGGPFSVAAGQWGTTCRLVGDFDARVEYELLDWPPANGVMVQLTAWATDFSMTVGRQSQTWGEAYQGWFPNRALSVPTADTKGAFRIRRHDGFLFAYYRDANGWSVIRTATHSGAPLIGLQAMTTDEEFAHKPVAVAFDNFSLTASKPAC
jgi:hypothetical protein